MRKIFIPRGPAGSGKSYWAKMFKEQQEMNHTGWVEIVSADDFFVDKDGVYRWNKDKLYEAHKWCVSRAKDIMIEMVEWDEKLGPENHMEPEDYYLIVDNTNIKRKDFKEYVKLAKLYNFEVVEKIFADFSEEAIQKYAQRNTHKVPIETIRKMTNSLQDSLKNGQGI